MPHPNPTKLVTDTTFTLWPKHMHPGHCFLWQMEGGPVFYSRVLKTPEPILAKGFRKTKTFGAPFPSGQEAYIPQDVATMLLSQEQMDLARKLGWPTDESTLWKIYQVPTN